MAALPSDLLGEDLLLHGLPGASAGLLDDLQVRRRPAAQVPAAPAHEASPTHQPPSLPLLFPLPQLDCGLAGLEGLEGLGDLGLDPATSDLLDSLQLDASPFAPPAFSTGGHRASPSGSGSDSPVALQLGVLADPLAPVPATSAAAAAAFGLAAAPAGRGSCGRGSPATSESENNGQAARGRSGSPAGGSAAPLQGGHEASADEEKRLVSLGCAEGLCLRGASVRRLVVWM